ncbi:MAG: RHS repeat-associated core domain-containing protein [Chlamydiales bacterium]|nr:RHS repeat-associated core domain-containing protein [Chlamydiales bacterium]
MLRSLAMLTALLFFSSATLNADSTQFLSHTEVDGDPSALVAGCVNAITGSFSDNEIDIVIPGPEPLIFQRFYCSTDWEGGVLCDNWSYNHAKQATLYHEGGQYQFGVAEATGGALLYKGGKVRREKTDHERHYLVPLTRIDADIKTGNDKGLTNIGCEEISGRTNLKNQSASYHNDTNNLVTHLCNGCVRTYQPEKPVGYWDVLPIHFVLTSETRPNGNQAIYEYSTERNKKLLSKISTANATGQETFASLHYDYSGCNNRSTTHTLKLSADDGREVNYTFKYHPFKVGINFWDRWYLTEAVRPNAPKISYDYITHPDWIVALVCRKATADNRFLEIDYYRNGSNFAGKEKIEIPKGHDRRVGKVRTLKSPAGIDSEAVSTYSFVYNTGFTDAYDAYNHKTRYRYNASERLTSIERYSGTDDHKPYATEKYFWGHQSTNEHCNLRCKALLDHNSMVRSCRVLDYDEHHNVTSEKIYGNLSGSCDVCPILDGAGVPIDNGCECCVIKRTYSQDAFHLLMSETLPNGCTTRYTYQPGTNLVRSKLVGDGLRIHLRDFCDYDSNGTLILSISDNGCGERANDLSGVTFRKITRVTPSLEAHHLPHVVEESFWDKKASSEQRLSKKVNTYSREGWLTRQEHYNADDQLCYTLCWDYDYMGNVILEQNALGEITERSYDANGNKIKEKVLGQNHHKTYVYDFSNRLIGESIKCDSGEVFHQSYSYDYLGNRTSHTDVLGQKTTCTFDDFGRCISTTLPDKKLTTHLEYDIAGNVTAITDVMGNRTLKRYNLRGKPTEVLYPDGSSESFRYNLDGSLNYQVAPNGTKTCFAYDVLGNVIRRDVYDASGKILTTSTATYQGNLLVSEVDPNGNTKHYTYDGAGRQTVVATEHTWTRYEYDSLGRKYRTIQWVGPSEDDISVTAHEFDLLDRIIEERIEDGKGNVYTRTQTAYDLAGNPCSTTIFTAAGPATTCALYNPLGKPSEVVDALGNRTLTRYDYSGKTLRVTVIDPIGQQAITEHDIFGHPTQITRKDMFGQEIAHTSYLYNPHGKLVKQTDTALLDGKAIREMVTEWQYDSIGRLVTLIEAAGSPLRRVTYYSYNAFGEKVTDIHTDGSEINYHYDSMGRLGSYKSSDGSVSYQFTYDSNSNILQIFDGVHNTTTIRQYDRENRVVSETLASGLTMTYGYDGLGRMGDLSLPDASSVRYCYDAGFLRNVARCDPSGNELYSHRYLDYDSAGQLTSAQMIKNAGDITYCYDALKRTTGIHSTHFEEHIPSDGYDAIGNLLIMQKKDAIGPSINRYTYDTLYQLASEEGAFNHRYKYDSLNNRMKKDDVDYEVDVLNQLQTQQDTSYDYDARGNRVEKQSPEESHRYRYDALNRLIEVQAGTQRWQYRYDSYNRRISKSHYDKDSRVSHQDYLYQDQMDIGTVEADKLTEFRMIGRGLGAEIGAAVAIELGDKLFAPLHDHSGNIVALVNADNGKVAEAYRYSAFGEASCYQPGWLWGWSPSKKHLSPWQFASKRYDAESKLTNFGRRSYDAEVGRWLTPDPSGFEDGPNLYAYVHNSPLVHIDLYGLCTERCAKCGRPLNGQQRHSTGYKQWDPQARRYTYGRGQRIYHCPNFEKITPRVPASRTGDLGEDRKKLEYGAIGFINGICNHFRDAFNHAMHISDLSGGFNVNFICNQTHNIIFDIMECILGVHHVTTRPVELLHKEWDKSLAAEPTILQICTSQGVIHVRNALLTYPEHLRNRIIVLAIAPAVYIDRDLCRQVIHYRAADPRRDFIPRCFDKRGEARAREQGTIRDVPSHKDASFFDHSISSPTYSDPIQHHIQQYTNSQGQRI